MAAPDQTASNSQKKASYVFKDTPIREALERVARDAGYRIVKWPDSMQGKVTLSLRDCPPEGVFNLIFKIQGAYTFHVLRTARQQTSFDVVIEEVDHGCRIDYTALQRSRNGEEIHAILPIPLEHTKAADVAATIKGVYPNVEVQIQEDQNFVVVRGPNTQLREINEFVHRLDVPKPPVKSKAR